MALRVHTEPNPTRMLGMPIKCTILHTETQARWLGLPSKKARKRPVICNPRKSNSRANVQSPPYTSNCQPDIFGALVTNGWIAIPARSVSCTKQKNFQSEILGFTCLTDLMPLCNSTLLPFFQSIFSEKDESWHATAATLLTFEDKLTTIMKVLQRFRNPFCIAWPAASFVSK